MQEIAKLTRFADGQWQVYSFLWSMGQASGALLTCALTVQITWTKTGI